MICITAGHHCGNREGSNGVAGGKAALPVYGRAGESYQLSE